MGENFGRRGPLGRVESEEGGKKLRSGGGLEREFGADNSPSRGCAAWESEGFGVGEAFEAGPGFFGRDSAQFKYLRWGKEQEF